jgi:hypothetical protein
MALERGRCIGHGAIPIFEQEKPYKLLEGVANPPTLIAGTELKVADGVYEHGFAVVTLGLSGSKTKVAYLTETGLIYEETF